jgi:hypothetical protein
LFNFLLPRVGSVRLYRASPTEFVIPAAYPKAQSAHGDAFFQFSLR